MAFDLMGMLQQYMGGGAAQPADKAADHFQQAAQHAPPEVVSQGISEAFRSDQTPPFGEMIGKLFSQANPQQQAAMLQQLLGNISPAALASLTGGGALAGLAGQASTGSIAPEKAAQVTPQQVQDIANHAEQQSPGIIDKMSSFYAQHPGLVKTLGGAALSIALAKMANGMKG